MTAVITGNLFYKMYLSWEIAVCVCICVCTVYVLYACACAHANLCACTHQRVSLQRA